MGGSFPPAILFIGDSFLAEERTQSLLKEARSQIKGEVFTQSFRFPEASLESLLASARTLPFLAAFQIFHLQDVHLLKEKKLEPLADYLAAPSKATLLLLETPALDRDHALVKLISKNGQVIFLETAEKKSAGARLVREKLKKAGKVLAPGVLERLEEQAGEAPAFIDTVLDQLMLYAGDQKEITEEMASAFEENWKEPNIFALTDAIAGRKTKEALLCLKEILEQDEKELIPLLGLLHWQVRRFWQAKVLLEEGAPQSEIMKKCRISPRQAPFFWRQLQSLTRERLEKALEGLFRLDWNLKTGRAEGAVDLERWVVQTTS